MTSNVIQGHHRRTFSFKSNFSSNIFCLNLIVLKLVMNAKIIKTQFVHRINYDLRGHGRSNKAFF